MSSKKCLLLAFHIAYIIMPHCSNSSQVRRCIMVRVNMKKSEVAAGLF